MPDTRDGVLRLVDAGWVFHDTDQDEPFIENLARPSMEFWEILAQLRQEGAIRIVDDGPSFRRRYVLA